MTRVKICGIRSLEEAMVAYSSGAWAIGQVFAPSRRRIEVEQAANINRDLPADIIKVGVFVNEDIDYLQQVVRACSLNAVQLHGDESPEYIDEINVPVIKSFSVTGMIDPNYVKRWRARAYLFDAVGIDAQGGSGISFNWKWLQEVKDLPNLILAGGLNDSNVVQAIEAVRPMAVDVSSGVEFKQGGKDPAAIDRFVNKVREADRIVSC